MPADVLLKRKAARAHLIPFTQYTMAKFEVAVHHHIIASALERVERGECKRLIIEMPPRHTKTELASRRYPAWYLGRNPDKQIICASYSADLANEIGRDVRDIVKQPEYSELFTTTLRRDVAAASRWKTTDGGIYTSAGVIGPLTGKGAHLADIDDPFKDDQEALSETRRELVWNWYSAVLYTRLMPDGAIVLINTRWHEDDLAGRLIYEMKHTPGADLWEIIELAAWDEDRRSKYYFVEKYDLPDASMMTLPQIADAMENVGKRKEPEGLQIASRALWPEWFGEKDLMRKKAVMVPRHWNALYQQNPTPDDGTYYRRKNIKYWVPPNSPAVYLLKYSIIPHPSQLRFYGTSDYATMEGKGDFTVHCVWAVDSEDNIYLMDVWRKQCESKEWVDAVIMLMKKWGCSAWIEEEGQIIKSVGPFLRKRMREEKVYTPRVRYVSHAKKDVRSRSFQGRTEMGMIYFPFGAPFTDECMNELLKFPNGKWDDFCDNCSLIGRCVDKLIRGTPPKVINDDAIAGGFGNLTLNHLWADHHNRLHGRDRVE